MFINPGVKASYDHNAVCDDTLLNKVYFKNKTDDTQKEWANRFIEYLKSFPSVRSAWIDDWGRFGNFSVFVTLHDPDRYSTMRLKGMLTKTSKKLAKEMKESEFSVHAQVFDRYGVEEEPWGEMNYSGAYWGVDLDIYSDNF